jgi:hypothetical protein
MVDTQRARVLGLFGELELDDLSLALKPIEAQRVSSAELKAKWLAGLAEGSDARALLALMEPIDVIVLAEALEGRSVDMNRQT